MAIMDGIIRPEIELMSSFMPQFSLRVRNRASRTL
jgi:hypothetical protein